MKSDIKKISTNKCSSYILSTPFNKKSICDQVTIIHHEYPKCRIFIMYYAISCFPNISSKISRYFNLREGLKMLNLKTKSFRD